MIAMNAPTPARRPVERTLHGVTVVDEYAWMKEREDPEVLEHLERENRHTSAVTGHLAALRAELYDEFKARTLETDLSVPARRGDWWYSTRTEEGKPYRIWVRRSGGPDGPEQVLLDENTAAEGHDYFRLGYLLVDPTDAVVAYAVDVDGSERFVVRFREAGSDVDLPDVVPLASYSAAWSSDGRTLFYTVPDDAMRPWQVWRHRLGTDAADDVLVYQEDDERFSLDVSRTRSGGFVLIGAGSATTSEVLAIDAADPAAEPRSVAGRVDGVEYRVDHRDDEFWIVTEDDALDGRLVRVPVNGGEPVEVMAHVEGRRLVAPDCYAGHVVVWGRQDGRSAAFVVRDGAPPRALVFDEEVYQLDPGRNLEFDTDLLRVGFESPVIPPSVYDVDVVTGERTLLKRTPVLGGVDLGSYRAVREWAEADDGSRIPVSVVHHVDTPLDGTAALVVYAYGAYEISIPPRFSIPRLSLLDRGVVYAIAHVRGGGEMGKRWHREGRMAAKMNTFTDLIAVTEHLVDSGYGDRHRVGARGASAGGLTMGAVVNLAPSMFRVVVAEVPFVDVINTMLDDSLPLTIVEWEEWGNPSVPEQYEWMAAYAPYENVAAVEHPAILATGGLNDPRVGYWEPAKWVARLRERTTGTRPIVLKTEMGAGHFARSGRYEMWEDEAFVLAFVLDQLASGSSPGAGSGSSGDGPDVS